MSQPDHAHLYQAVPVLFWPWLWWQLFRLRLWSEASGRDVLFGVDRWGNLRVHLVGDEPGRWTPSRHPHLHQYYLTEDLPDETRPKWRARLAAVFCGGIGVPDWVIFPRRTGEACGAETYETPARIRDPVEGEGTALSLVHGLTKPDRNPLRIACPKGLARCQTQPFPYRLRSDSGLYPPPADTCAGRYPWTLHPPGLAGREGLGIGPALRRCAPAGRSRFRDSAMRCA